MRSGFGNISSAWSIWLWVITMFFYWRTTYHSFWSWSHDLRPILKLPSVDLTHQKQKKQSSINVDLAHHEQTRISRLFSYKTYHHPLWCCELPRSGTSDNLLRRTAERDFIRRGVVTVSCNCNHINFRHFWGGEGMILRVANFVMRLMRCGVIWTGFTFFYSVLLIWFRNVYTDDELIVKSIGRLTYGLNERNKYLHWRKSEVWNPEARLISIS